MASEAPKDDLLAMATMGKSTGSEYEMRWKMLMVGTHIIAHT
jgi:hypothetical protein